MADVLTSHSWYRAGENPSSTSVARYVFRSGGRGRYEPSLRPDVPPDERVERSRPQEFRYEAKGGELRIRFAKAREWFQTPYSIEPGPRKYSEDARFARHVLRFKRDPYAFVIAGVPEENTAWESDAGAELPG